MWLAALAPAATLQLQFILVLLSRIMTDHRSGRSTPERASGGGGALLLLHLSLLTSAGSSVCAGVTAAEVRVTAKSRQQRLQTRCDGTPIWRLQMSLISAVLTGESAAAA